MRIFSLFLFIVLSSCNNQNDGNHVKKTLNISKNKRESKLQIYTLSSLPIDTNSFNKYLNSDSVKLFLKILEIKRDKEFLDRFAMDSSINISFTENKSNIVSFNIHFYKDSIESKNAFFNWLDQEKNSTIGTTTSMSQKPMYFILTEKHFQRISTSKEINLNKVLQLSRFFSQKDKLIYFISSNRKESNWYSIKENKLIKEQNENSK